MLSATWRIGRAGILAAAALAAAGWLLGRARFGASDEAAVGRVEAELVEAFASSAGALGRTAARLAAAREAILDAQRGPATARSLFEIVDAALAGQDPARTGATVYNAPLDEPIAWGGRASDLPRGLIDGPARLVVAPGALGPRLVRVEPVVDRARAGSPRIATVVVEQQIGQVRTAPGAADTFLISTRLVPVSLRVRVGDVSPPASP